MTAAPVSPLLPRASATRGFSLVEMMAVILIIGVLIAGAAQGAKKSFESQEIKASAMRLAQDITLASQTALKLNRTVQLRLFKFSDPNIVAEQAQYRSWQIIGVEPDGTGKPIYEAQTFEGTTILSSSRRFSTALGSETGASGTLPGGGAQGAYEVTFIEFRPDGSTNLDPNEQNPWTLTLIPVRYSERVGELPKEFRTLVIAPENGAVRIY